MWMKEEHEKGKNGEPKEGKKVFPSHIQEKAHFPPSHQRVRESEENRYCTCGGVCQTQAHKSEKEVT